MGYGNKKNEPEHPDRLKKIEEALNRAGILEQCSVVPKGRRLTFAESQLAHNSEPWKLLEKFSKMSKKDIRRWNDDHAEDHESLFYNQTTFECTKTAIGGILEALDQMKRHGGAAMTIVRPPGQSVLTVF